MALRKTKEINSTGVNGEYWKINNVKMEMVNYNDSTISTIEVEVVISIYRDEDARFSGKSPFKNETYRFDSGFDLETLSSKNPVQRAYEKLKSDITFFNDAVDC